MGRLIELHRDDKEHTPLVVNVDWIVWFEQREDYTLIALGYGGLKGNNGNLSTQIEYICVYEKYEELKDILNV